MRSLRQRIPPLPCLIAFEASSRLLSFTKAAKEIGVTQAAVSRQIHELEEYLEVSLFDRRYRSIELTPVGTLLSDGLTAHLNSIASIADRVREMRNEQTIVVGMTSAFGAYWLAPRLAEFHQLHPEVRVRLAVSDEIVDLQRQSIDISIRFGHGRWPQLMSSFFMGTEQIPICHPSYWGGRTRPSDPARLADEVLLCLEGTPAFLDSQWSAWFAAHGVRPTEGKRRIEVNDFNTLVQTALSGQGIALGPFPFIDRLMADGLLVPAIDSEPIRIPGGYYVVEAEGQVRKRSCEDFRKWLFDRLKSDAAANSTERLLHEKSSPA